MVSNSISEAEHTIFEKDTDRSANDNSLKESFMLLFPTSIRFDTSKLDFPFPYFEYVLISWIENHKLVRIKIFNIKI